MSHQSVACPAPLPTPCHFPTPAALHPLLTPANQRAAQWPICTALLHCIYASKPLTVGRLRFMMIPLPLDRTTRHAHRHLPVWSRVVCSKPVALSDFCKTTVDRQHHQLPKAIQRNDISWKKCTHTNQLGPISHHRSRAVMRARAHGRRIS
jgi:hypothetical protein